jgi:hypothetical protein
MANQIALCGPKNWRAIVDPANRRASEDDWPFDYFLMPKKNSTETQPVALRLTGATISMGSKPGTAMVAVPTISSWSVGDSVTDGFCGNRAALRPNFGSPGVDFSGASGL